MNSKHVLITGLAVVVAGIFFFVTMLAAPNPKRANNDGGSEIVALDGWEKAPLGQKTGAPNVKGLAIHFADNHGVQYDLLGQSLTPKSKGVIDVNKPTARIHLKPNQTVLQISADQGTFITPTGETRSGMIGTVGQPTSGFLKGNVVIRLFENHTESPIQLTDGSAHEILTLHMEQANFDRDLGQIQADGLVKLDGRDVAFEGENLNIIYSPLLQRINRLEIENGKYIRIKRVDDNGEFARDDQSNTNTQTADNSGSDPANKSEPEQTKSVQYYHITLTNRVAIEAQKTRLTGNELELYLGMESRDQDQQDESENAATPTHDQSQPANTKPTDTPVQVTEETKPVVDDPDDDILITWTGPLLMLPTEGKPQMLADARDVYMQITGSPMQIMPESKDLITAANIDYLHSQSRLRIRSSDIYPLIIDSPQLGGLITGESYVMYLDKALGMLQGKGELRGLSRPVIAQTEDAATSQTKEKSLPAGTSVKWQDRVDLVFYHDPADENDHKLKADFDKVKSITFRGDVQVEHEDFDVKSDLVSLQLTEPTEEHNRQDVRAIKASGNVALRTHSTDPERQMALHSEIASIAFEPDDKGKMLPVQLKADDKVVIRRPNQVLWADHLIVDLGHGTKPVITAINDTADTVQTVEADQTKDPVDALDTMLAWEEKEKPVPTVVPVEGQTTVADSTAANEKASGEDDNKLYLKRITVEGDVRARMINDDQPVFAFADKMTGDEQQVELFGSDKRPSQVMLDAGILAGDHLVFTLNDQNLHVIGKGTLSFLSHPIDEKTGEVIQDNGLTKPKGELNAQPVSAINVDGNQSTDTNAASSNTTDNNTTNTVIATDGEQEPTVPTLPSLEPAKVHVSWQDNMHYNHKVRQAQFLGSVFLTAERTHGATTVKGDDITVLFSKFVDHPTTTNAYQTPNLPSVNDQGLIETQSLKGGRQIRMVDIKGNAEFLEESWAPAPGSAPENMTGGNHVALDENDKPKRGPLLTRLRLAGQNMIFDALPETITIPGAGTLLHEDHRPKTSSGNSEDVQFTGRGRTLFRWQDQFLLDIAHNDMIMKDYVQMLHLPADSDNGIQLDCRTFLADMQATGGLGTWLSGDAPTPDLKVVQASRDVRITAENRQITTDRATYIHNVRKVKLQADENKLTRITTQAGTSVGVELIIWELDNNRFYIAKPGLINEVAPRQR